ncbi:MAG: HGxxPAAW family protein [Bowdeniella nasicola]|nr:HGxxPAAW family protein [Bowdeniella nasicola]
MNETYTLPPAAPFHNEGKTTASWVFITLVVIGSCVIATGMVLYSVVAQIAGAAIIALGCLAGIGLRAAGKGQPRSRDQRGWYED